MVNKPLIVKTCIVYDTATNRNSRYFINYLIAETRLRTRLIKYPNYPTGIFLRMAGICTRAAYYASEAQALHIRVTLISERFSLDNIKGRKRGGGFSLFKTSLPLDGIMRLRYALPRPLRSLSIVR